MNRRKHALQDVIIGNKTGHTFILEETGNSYEARGGSRGMDNPSTLVDDVHTKKEQNVSQKFAKWGSDNKLPYRIIKLIIDNALLLPLLSFKVDMLIGDGLFIYHEDEAGNKIKVQDNQIEDFFYENELTDVFEGIVTDFYFFGNFFLEFILSRGSFVDSYGKSIATAHHIDATVVRPQRAKDKFSAVSNFDLNPDWKNFQQADTKTLPAFRRDRLKRKSIAQYKSYFPGNTYYGVPLWLGANQSIEYLNKIPLYKNNLISNIATPSWLVRVPADYFRIRHGNGELTAEKKREYESELAQEIEDFLQGPENSGKLLITYTWKDTSGKTMEIEIIGLKNEIPDKLFSDDFDQMFQILCSATQVPPSLASMLVPGKLSSGSDILNSWNAYNARIARHRQKVLRFLYDIAKVNDWSRDIKFDFKNKVLRTTDYSKAGIENE